jgi:antibiotic biosynthesis monooxygenase (ABM) superfamily enzyme
MLVIVFRSRLKPGLRDEYVALVDRMAELARTMPGYISHKGFLHRETSECRASRGFQEAI